MGLSIDSISNGQTEDDGAMIAAHDELSDDAIAKLLFQGFGNEKVVQSPPG